ncbi:MAG: ribonuclease HI [Thermodesulfobacteriota bacterium]
MTADAASRPVTVFTDGSCLGNPGPGGWACVLLWSGRRKELSGGYARTTNNRMEIYAVLMALGSLKRACEVELHTDSRYLADAVEKRWLAKWQKNGWKTADKKPVKNRDLWERLAALLKEHRVRFRWVKAHNGLPENERCDVLAKAAAGQRGLPPDEGYEAGMG